MFLEDVKAGKSNSSSKKEEILVGFHLEIDIFLSFQTYTYLNINKNDKIVKKFMILKYPVKNPIIEQEFGRDNKDDPIYSKFYELFDYKHPGIDFELNIGTEIYASFPGAVVRVENHKGMGNVISIRNGNILALFAHLSEIKVSLGQVVNEGQVIGLSGKTGEACTTPHLHFELRDLSKNLLKNMVFEPIFNLEIQRYSTTFTYTVNNLNTPKNLNLLAERYFGNQKNWTDIKEINKLSISEFDTLPDGLEIIIPNYKQI